MTNFEFAQSNQLFIKACNRGNISPTKKQASKYRKHTGAAWDQLTVIEKHHIIGSEFAEHNEKKQTLNASWARLKQSIRLSYGKPTIAEDI